MSPIVTVPAGVPTVWECNNLPCKVKGVCVGAKGELIILVSIRAAAGHTSGNWVDSDMARSNIRC
jgi:hypothetical protein